MSNILITFEVRDNTTDNNIQGLITVLSKMEVPYRVCKASRVTKSDIEWCDVYIANRPNSIYSQRISHAAKQSGRFVIVALDDDIAHFPKSHPNHWKNKYVFKCLAIADSLMSPNILILDDFCGQYNLRRVLTISFIQDGELKKEHPIGEKIRIVYPAGKDHIELFDRYIQPFFNNFVKKYSDKVDVTFVGIEPKVQASNAVHFVEGMPYNNYLAFMETHDFDIGLAPLDDNPFCARKYFAKYIEYSKYGILGLYSNVKPYTFAVKDGYNGVLVDGTAEQWEKTLEEIFNAPEKINLLLRNAQNDLTDKYSLENAVNRLKEGVPEIINYHSDLSRVKFNNIDLQRIVYSIRDFANKACYHLRHDGLSYVLRFLK